MADSVPNGQVLLDESLALEMAQEWSEGTHRAHEHNKIAIRNFHFLRQAAQTAQADGTLNGAQPQSDQHA